MNRDFNTAGPNELAEHYSIDPFERIDWPEIQHLIDRKRYFILHAPRQTGKTTLLEAIVQRLNAEGCYDAMRFSVNSGHTSRNNVAEGMRTISDHLFLEAEFRLPRSWLATEGRSAVQKLSPGCVITTLLTAWAANAPKPLVLLIDEIDALVGDTLVSMLTQLRDGYIARPRPFPQSVILCGVRDIRDYRIETSSGKAVTGGSCFNVKAKSLRLGNFAETEVRDLYGQHTTETGQIFEDVIFPKVMTLTGGQPWLVNALANELTHEIPALRDRSRSIGLEEVDEAKERLILRCDTHLDQLAHKLKEQRVRRVIAPILTGDKTSSASTEDRMYTIDLGLVVMQGDGIQIANAIYREVIPRELASDFEGDIAIKLSRSAFLLSDGRLDFRELIARFQQFYRENADAWTKRAMYPEAATHILLQCWLQRVVNGGGQIEREYALGTERADILVRHFLVKDGKRAEQRFVLEMKVVRAHQSAETVMKKGLEQTARYADKCDPEEAHLVVIDQREGRSWDDRVYVREQQHEGRAVTVWGM